MSNILSFEEARRAVEEHASSVPATGTEMVALLAAAGRVLAEPVLADRDIPPFPRSTRDGYAIRSADLAKLPASLAIVGEIKAGESMDRIPSRLGSGQAVSIMTGAPVPEGADAVVMVEFTTPQQDRVEIARAVAAGENIVPRGAEARVSSVLLHPGMRLNESAIALAASVGRSEILVYRRPRVAVLTTGDEIIEVAATPGPTQIRNSNSYSLAAQICNSGGEPVLLPIAPDEPRQLRALIEEGLRSSLLVITGGVSMGRYDLIEPVFSEMHAEFFFTGANIQPGRPVVFGRCASPQKSSPIYFFGLPGNPISTMVTFELLTRPLLEALSGQSPRQIVFLHARLKSDIRTKIGLKRFLPAVLSGKFEDTLVELVPWQGSGDIAAAARSNCYIVLSDDREHFSAGEWVPILLR